MADGSTDGRLPGDRRSRDEGTLRVRFASRPPAGEDGSEEIRGIGFAGGFRSGPSRRPRIAAFIWGERQDAPPTLPFGRWKAAS